MKEKIFRLAPPVLLVALFFLTRSAGMLYFAPHNDEIIDAEFAQLMAADWQANRFITLDGTFGDEFKMPLQFWLGSLTIDIPDDPLLGLRPWTLLLGFCGFVFASLFVARLHGRTAGLFTAAFIVLSEYYLYFDSVAVTEAFVYGAGAAYIFFLYLGLDSSTLRVRVAALGLATVAFLIAVAAKRSGLLWLPVGLALPLVLAHDRSPRKLIRAWIIVLGVTLLAWAPVFFFISGRFAGRLAGSIQNALVFSMGELILLPVGAWLRNAAYFYSPVLSGDGILWPLFALILVGFAWFQSRRTDTKSAAALARFLYLPLATSLPLVLVAKAVLVRFFGFGLYFYYAACAVALSLVWQKLPAHRRGMILIAFTVWSLWKIHDTYRPLFRWGQTDLAIHETRDDWAKGLGMRELIAYTKTLPPGALVYDHRWGLPGTGLKVYRAWYPQLELLPASPENLTRLHTIIKTKPRIYFAFAHNLARPRRPRYQLIRENLCQNKVEFLKRYRDRVLPGRIILCRIDRNDR